MRPLLQDRISITLTKGTSATIKVYDLQGKCLIEERFNESLIEYPLQNLAKGIYLIEINTGNKVSINRILKE